MLLTRNLLIDAGSLVLMQDDATARWHRDAAFTADPGSLAGLMLWQHRANFDLWHQEDDARSPDASDHDIAEVKHAIDRLNQLRNDLVERLDGMLLEAAGQQNAGAPLHSETPGLIIDRLSILALKIYHTAAEADRGTATEEHRENNRRRLTVLTHQRDDLAACLDTLWAEIVGGQRRFQLYRQMKMYNDPALNPVLYSRG